ncbi:O-antigen ligase family protein [Clostridium swellfunianum]|uniref:O-antigen ligase family protein n=1 Tax=Clostridium swellfunianum TaxID=1367462 RepID=UPI002030E69B|nr:O-antigen ligase family protein [Clostridium swellfunianum]MCM0648613.1 O-antigen ligase family protein [Clostridium swellfunianum]
MNFKEIKLFKNKWTTIALYVVVYSLIMLALPRVTGYLTIIGIVAYGFYLFFKNQKFKEKTKLSKGLTCLGLIFVILWGLALTTLSPESIKQGKVSSEKLQLEKQEKLAADKKAKEEDDKKQTEEKSKREELTKQEEAKKEESVKEEQKQEPVKEEPKQEEPKKEEPKQEAPAKNVSTTKPTETSMPEPTPAKPTPTPDPKPVEETKPQPKPVEQPKPEPVNAFIYNEELTNQYNATFTDNHKYNGAAYKHMINAAKAYTEGKVSSDYIRAVTKVGDRVPYAFTKDPLQIGRKYWSEPDLYNFNTDSETIGLTKTTVTAGTINEIHDRAKAQGLYKEPWGVEYAKLNFKRVVIYKNEATNQIRIGRMVVALFSASGDGRGTYEPGYKFP